ncbi:MAG TPA: sodium:solute symporter family protein [Longimicrobiales bacterium]|nr:sodium:solute symporter family protein [Longimicrobiales bacterium]
MERWQTITIVVSLYLLITLVIGILSGRRTSHGVTGYVAADRRFGVLPMYFIVGGTIFSAFAFLGGPGWAYSQGTAVLYILSYGVLGIAPWYFVGPKAARIGRRYELVTQAQLVTTRFPSRTLSALMAVLAVAAFVPYVMLQMTGAGIVFSAVTQGHVPFWLGAGVAYGVVITYVLIGGAAAVGWTNVFEGIVMMIVAWGLGLYLPYALYGGIGPMFEQIEAARPELLTLPGLRGNGEPWSWGAYSTAILSSAIGFAMWPHLFMKAFTARSEAVLRRTVVLFPTFQLFLIPLILVGFAGVMFASAPRAPDFILPHLILETTLPAIVVGIFCAGALAASMSTGDALLHGAASIAIEDGIHPFVTLGERQRRLLMQGLVLVVGGVAYYLAIVKQTSLVWLLLSAYGLIDQLAPPVYAALYWRRATTPGVLAGLLAGSATCVFFFLNPALKPFEMHEGILGLFVNVPVLVLVSRLTRAQDAARSSAFVDARSGQRDDAVRMPAA